MSMRAQIAKQPAAPARALTPAPFRTLQRQCACGGSGASGGECEDCRKKEMALRRTTADRTVPAGLPPIGRQALRSPGQTPVSETRAFFDPPFAHNFCRLPVEWHAGPPGTVEEVGQAHCDLDLGRMTWSVDATKLPVCMADCAMVHEQTHVEFGKASCAKVVAAYKAAMDAINKAEKSKSDVDLKDAERKMDDLQKATDEYTKWFGDTCRENERRAYQAGIDACKKDDVRKSCADLKETAGYDKMMKDWEKFRDNPPNCPAAPEDTKKKEAGKKEGKEPKKTEPAKLSGFLPQAVPQLIVPESRCACGEHTAGGGECAACREKEEDSSASRGVMRRATADRERGIESPPLVHGVLRSPGQLLDAETRAFFEPRFGHDFGQVRIHADGRAGESAGAVNALAYAVGQDIVFGAGQYAPHTAAGRKLLAHELAHTLQQGLGTGMGLGPGRLRVGDPAEAAEREAEVAAQAVLAEGQTAVANEPAAPPALRRQDGPVDVPPAVQNAPQPDPGAPGTVTQAGGTGAGGGSSSTTATCQPTGLDRAAFLALAGATTDDFGLTTLDTIAVTYPTVSTNPAKPSGVVVAPTTAALPTIPSVYTKAGMFVEGDMNLIGGDDRSCPSGKYPLKWIIAPQGTQKIAEGEQEHCNDFQLAFDISLKLYADAVNALAASGRVFPNDKAVEASLTGTTGAAPANWQSIFVCLAHKSLLRDPRTKGAASWHTPRPTRLAPNFPDCKQGRAIISDLSLPEVGKHPSSDIIKGCGEKQAATTAGKK